MCVWGGGGGQGSGQPRGVGGEGFESEIPFPEHSLLPVRLQQRLLLPCCKSKLSPWPSEVREARESFSRNSKQVSELQDLLPTCQAASSGPSLATLVAAFIATLIKAENSYSSEDFSTATGIKWLPKLRGQCFMAGLQRR